LAGDIRARLNVHLLHATKMKVFFWIKVDVWAPPPEAPDSQAIHATTMHIKYWTDIPTAASEGRETLYRILLVPSVEALPDDSLFEFLERRVFGWSTETSPIASLKIQGIDPTQNPLPRGKEWGMFRCVPPYNGWELQDRQCARVKLGAEYGTYMWLRPEHVGACDGACYRDDPAANLATRKRCRGHFQVRMELRDPDARPHPEVQTVLDRRGGKLVIGDGSSQGDPGFIRPLQTNGPVE
jgi:hypothetical protein